MVVELTDSACTFPGAMSPLSDFMAEGAQTRPVVGRHLNLIVSPDDEVLQQQVGHIGTGDVLHLVVHRQPSQTTKTVIFKCSGGN
ncbi:hypothetical protein EYF80_054228 [Liparis tanakae]|uniref:Uncharacterized protein n=1 Tax=Liparis tanakae TaxID=230148 RepID=A0A4Z2F384_9TELE|nr:hypothetical protein EYF80_054228 [Liparis tanakae]